MVCSAPLAAPDGVVSGVLDALRLRAVERRDMTTHPKPYTAVRLVREKGRDEYDRHFSVDWDSARELFDPSRLFRDHAGDAQAGEVWALWSVAIGPGWRTYANRNRPAFLLVKHSTWEALMLDATYASEIRELSFNREEVTT